MRVLVPPLQKSRPNIGSGGSTKRKDDGEQSRSSIGKLLASSLGLPLTRLRGQEPTTIQEASLKPQLRTTKLVEESFTFMTEGYGKRLDSTKEELNELRKSLTGAGFALEETTF